MHGTNVEKKNQKNDKKEGRGRGGHFLPTVLNSTEISSTSREQFNEGQLLPLNSAGPFSHNGTQILFLAPSFFQFIAFFRSVPVLCVRQQASPQTGSYIQLASYDSQICRSGFLRNSDSIPQCSRLRTLHCKWQHSAAVFTGNSVQG